MNAMLERLERVEQEVSRLSERLTLLEGPAEAPVAKPQLPRSVPAVPRPTALPPPRALPAARPAVRALDLEELLGGRLFALAGGAAVLVGAPSSSSSLSSAAGSERRCAPCSPRGPRRRCVRR